MFALYKCSFLRFKVNETLSSAGTGMTSRYLFSSAPKAIFVISAI